MATKLIQEGKVPLVFMDRGDWTSLLSTALEITEIILGRLLIDHKTRG
jgi:hypothetical protein